MGAIYGIKPTQPTKIQSVRRAFSQDAKRKKRKLFFEPVPEAKTINLDLLKIAFRQTKGKSYQTDKAIIFDSEFFKPNSVEKNVGQFVIRKNETRKGRVFSLIHDVFFKGVHVASVESAPFSNHIKGPDECILRLSNQCLYTEWFPLLKKMAAAFCLEFISVSQMDIALDGFNFLYPIKKTLMQKVDLVGNSDWCPRISGGNKIKAMTIGSRKNHRYCRAYNKSNEIDQHSKKYYIREFWQNSGIPKYLCDKVERLEVVLKSAEIKKYEDKQDWTFLQRLTDASYLAAIADQSFSRLYEFREKTIQKNVTRAKRVFKIAYSIAKKSITLKSRQAAKRIRAFQTTIKQTYLLYLKTGRSDLINYVDEMLYNLGFDEWFQKRKTAFDYEFHLTDRHDDDFINLWDQDSKQFVRPELVGTASNSRRKLIL